MKQDRARNGQYLTLMNQIVRTRDHGPKSQWEFQIEPGGSTHRWKYWKMILP